MSELKVNSIKGVAASDAAITINNTDGTCTANITINLSNRNLIINGAFLVAQRSSDPVNDDSYRTVDRFRLLYGGTDNHPTQAQHALTSSDTGPYQKGFRFSYHITNGDQSSGAGTNDNLYIQTKLESQDLANSGWNYTSASSFITLSFWVKSSVAQNFYGYLRTMDGTGQRYAFETGSLSADTWTKVTKTISGNSNLQFDNDANEGLQIIIAPFFGTAFTDSGVSLNAWGAYSGSARMPDNTSTWYTTDDATFEITGVQLEVGSVATVFEHRSFAQELDLCERYCQVIVRGVQYFGTCMLYTSSVHTSAFLWKKTMRSTPTIVANSGTNYYITYRNGSNAQYDALDGSISLGNENGGGVYTANGGGTAGQAGTMAGYKNETLVYIQAEL